MDSKTKHFLHNKPDPNKQFTNTFDKFATVKAVGKFKCSICNNDGDLILTINKYSIYECSSCTHVQVYPLPSIKSLVEHYNNASNSLDTSFAFSSLEDYKKSPVSRYRFSHQIFKDILKMPEMRSKDAKILEVGTSTGTDLAILRDFYNYKFLTGTDINNFATERGKQQLGLDLRSGEVSRKMFNDDKPFDVVFALQSIEHSINPKDLLREVNAILGVNRKIIINLPNYNSLSRTMLGSDWPVFTVPAHLHYFTTHSLNLALRETGFEPIKIYTENNVFPGGYCAEVLRILRKLNPWSKIITSESVPPYSYFSKYYSILLVADISLRIATFPIWFYMRMFDRGSTIIAIAKKIK